MGEHIGKVRGVDGVAILMLRLPRMMIYRLLVIIRVDGSAASAQQRIMKGAADDFDLKRGAMRLCCRGFDERRRAHMSILGAFLSRFSFTPQVKATPPHFTVIIRCFLSIRAMMSITDYRRCRRWRFTLSCISIYRGNIPLIAARFPGRLTPFDSLLYFVSSL